MGSHTMTSEVVVVGGGIAGSALATVLAREGIEVTVLERQLRFTDQVRGENLHPWGVAEVQRLGLEEVLLDAGAHRVTEMVDYGDGGGSEATPVPLAAMVEGVDGELNLAHPQACEALACAAERSGARLLRGVSHLEVEPGARPSVAFRHGGEQRRVDARLVVGADGRSSRVRRQCGIVLQRDPEPHLAAGLLVDDLEVASGRNAVGIGEDAWTVTFPQGGGRARIYVCADPGHPQRFAGPKGAARLLEAAAVDALPNPEVYLEATPSGPVRTFPADDTWTEQPFVEGTVLLGDAGGYTNPLIGQGLSLALRDVRALSDALLAQPAWNPPLLARYGRERAERLRRARVLGQLHAEVMVTFGPEAQERRRRIRESWQRDPSRLAAVLAIFTGPEATDPRTFEPDFRQRYLEAA